MRLHDAWALCEAGHAKLIIKDQNHPLCWGTADARGFGTLYMWTRGHTVPMLQCQRVDELPPEAEQEQCVCGDTHGFPTMRDEEGRLADVRGHRLWLELTNSNLWEPVFAMTILDAMVKEPEDQGP